jgi:hypothetical protein
MSTPATASASKVTADAFREIAENEAAGVARRRHPRRPGDPAVHLRLAASRRDAADHGLVRGGYRGDARRIRLPSRHDARLHRPITAPVGLGVGIDYALLSFSRYRSELLAEADREAGGRTALDTAGRAVLFACAT